MIREAFPLLKGTFNSLGIPLKGIVMSLDGSYDSKKNRKMIFNHGMVPNINYNKRNRKKTKRGRPRLFSEAIFKERFQTIERVFAWEDKFKRLLMRFEHKSENHYALKTIAYMLINLRHFVNKP